MTNPHDSIEEGRRLLAEIENGDANQWDVFRYFRENSTLFLHTLPSELAAAHARIAALEEGVRWIASHDNFGLTDGSPATRRCIDALVERAATLLSSAPDGEGETAAFKYALELATVLHDKHFPEVTQWQPLDTTLGLLTQIDNICSGLVAPPPTPAPPEDVVERIARAISPYLQRSYSGTNPDVDDQASGRDTARHVARLALSALEAKGLCIAPMGPTCEMIEAGVTADYGGTPGARAANCYRAMLASARKGGG